MDGDDASDAAVKVARSKRESYERVRDTRDNLAAVCREFVTRATDPPWRSSNTAWIAAVQKARVVLAQMDQEEP
jgi:hypothetical protein